MKEVTFKSMSRKVCWKIWSQGSSDTQNGISAKRPKIKNGAEDQLPRAGLKKKKTHKRPKKCNGDQKEACHLKQTKAVK